MIANWQLLTLASFTVLLATGCAVERTDDGSHADTTAARETVPVTTQAGGRVRVLAQLPLSSDDQGRLSGATPAASAGTSAELPSAASVRARMSPVRDQGSRATGAAFAALAMLEAGTTLDLSEQCLALFAGERDGGPVSAQFSYALSRGLYYEHECPYADTREQVPALPRASIALSQPATMLQSPSVAGLRELKQMIARGRSVAVTVWVTTPAFFEDADTIIDVPPPGEGLCVGAGSCGVHAVVVVGYDDAAGLLTFKNSWGTGWKDGGYGRMTYAYFMRSYVAEQAYQMLAY